MKKVLLAHYCSAYAAFARKAGYDKLAADFSAKLQAFMQSEDYLKILNKYGIGADTAK